MPDLSVHKFDYFDYNPKDLELLELKAIQTAKNIKVNTSKLKFDLLCKICDQNKFFKQNNDFIKHINSQDHTQKLKDFKKSLSYNLGIYKLD